MVDVARRQEGLSAYALLRLLLLVVLLLVLLLALLRRAPLPEPVRQPVPRRQVLPVLIDLPLWKSWQN